MRSTVCTLALAWLVGWRVLTCPSLRPSRVAEADRHEANLLRPPRMTRIGATMVLASHVRAHLVPPGGEAKRTQRRVKEALAAVAAQGATPTPCAWQLARAHGLWLACNAVGPQAAPTRAYMRKQVHELAIHDAAQVPSTTLYYNPAAHDLVLACAGSAIACLEVASKTTLRGS